MDLSSLQLAAGVDTFEITANIDLTEDFTGIKHLRPLNKCKSHGRQWKYKVTCDKIIEHGGYNIGDFIKIIDYVKVIFKDATELFISRFDIRFDNYAAGSYMEYYKITGALLLLLAYRHNFKNRYQSFDPVGYVLKTIRIDNNDDKQAEYYNKYLQKPELGIYARLELRSKQLNIDLFQPLDGFADSCAAEWFDMMIAAATKENFNGLKSQINQCICDNYIEGYNASVAEFIACNGLVVYDKKQAAQIFKAMNKDGRNGYDFFKQRPKQQIITIDDIKAYIELLRGFVTKFLCGEAQEQAF
jgi:hypothetical protein